MKFNPFHFWTKDYEIDLLAPFREIANDIKRMRKIKQKKKQKQKINIGLQQCATCKQNIKCNECIYPYQNEELIKDIDRLNAEKNKLQSQVNSLKKYDEERDISLHARLIEEAKAETVKKIMEMLRKDIVEDNENPHRNKYPILTHGYIDNFEKEILGKGND